MIVDSLSVQVPNTDPATLPMGLGTVFKTTPTPTWAAIEAAIRGLDGRTSTAVRLDTSDYRALSIGWAMGRYICNIMPEMSWLVDPTFAAAQITPHGDLPYRERHWVTLETALQAARHFADTGECDPSLAWVPYADLHR